MAAALLLLTLPVGGPTLTLATTGLATRALVIPGALGWWLSMVIIRIGVGRIGHSLGRAELCHKFRTGINLSCFSLSLLLTPYRAEPLSCSLLSFF